MSEPLICWPPPAVPTHWARTQQGSESSLGEQQPSVALWGAGLQPGLLQYMTQGFLIRMRHRYHTPKTHSGLYAAFTVRLLPCIDPTVAG